MSSSEGAGRWRSEDPARDETGFEQPDQPDLETGAADEQEPPRRLSFKDALESRREERLSGRKGPVWKWIEENGDDIFWLIVGGFGFTLIAGTGIRQIVDSPAAFVIAAAIWVVIAWRILVLLRRRSDRIEKMRRELAELESDEPG
ncbi:MAG: hypothetical protein ACR2N5_01010 [Solirubrobacterales bacterium]